MNRKASAFTDLFLIVALLFVVVLFFAGFMYGFGLVTNQLLDLEIVVLDSNVSTAAEDTFEFANNALGGLQWLALAIFFGMMIAIMVSNFLVKAHPVFFVLYILITVLAVVLAVPVSNAYETVLTDGVLSQTLNDSFSGVGFLLLNLPGVIAIIGFAGAIFLFVGITVDRDTGGGLT